MNIVNILISLTILLLGMLILNIELHHILVILIISVVVLFLFELNENRKFNNLSIINRNIGINSLNVNNINKVHKVNNLANQVNNLTNQVNKVNNLANQVNKANQVNNINTDIEYIIHPSMYNKLDCTTDKTCIQQPDKINLFPGFEKNEFKLNVEKEIIEDPIKKVDDIVVEKFDNPYEMNDIAMPFNSTIIDPYEHYKLVRNQSLGDDKCNESSGSDLCFHCRKGHCLGGVCRNIFEPKPGKLLSSNKKNIDFNAHPYSEDYPVIRASNPDLAL